MKYKIDIQVRNDSPARKFVDGFLTAVEIFANYMGMGYKVDECLTGNALYVQTDDFDLKEMITKQLKSQNVDVELKFEPETIGKTKTKLTRHPFVASPTKSICSSCGLSQYNSIHNI